IMTHRDDRAGRAAVPARAGAGTATAAAARGRAPAVRRRPPSRPIARCPADPAASPRPRPRASETRHGSRTLSRWYARHGHRTFGPFGSQRMSAGHATIDLAPLEARYEIVGELRGGGPHAYSTYFARRRDDGSEVIITVANATEGDNNALSHLASDTQLLRDSHHPNLPQVLDGIWLGSNAFAVVSERVRGRTLAERLDRGERIANPRIAVILQDVATVLDWARSQGVVHRGVTPETITFAAADNRAMVTLLPTPVPLDGVPKACADARTIGVLARDMLAGERLSDRPRDDAPTLAQVRRDLATRVLDATERMVACRQDGEAPSIAAFLAVVASADVLKQAEVEMAALKEEYE